MDLGDDVFTRGRPHPMLDGHVRREWIRREAQDPTVAVLLLDVVLGYGVATGSYVAGLAVSLVTDLPSSPVIVWAMAMLGILSEEGYPVEHAGVLAVPDTERAHPALKTLPGKKCP